MASITDKNVELILLLVSDGEPTDGNPEPLAKEITDFGGRFLACPLFRGPHTEFYGKQMTIHRKHSELHRGQKTLH